LIPQPSNDINDPLNWPKYKKALAFLSIITFTFTLTWMFAGIAYGIPGVITDLNITLNQAVDGLLSWAVLTIGLAVLIFPLFSDFVELLLDSYRSLYRKASRIHFCVVGHIRHVRCLRKNQKLPRFCRSKSHRRICWGFL
jgi:hypothetical protein